MAKVKLCEEHSGVCQRITDMSFFGKLAMIVFIIIGMAVVGFLWNSHEKLADKMDGKLNQVIGDLNQKKQDDEKYRDRMSRSVDLLLFQAGIRERVPEKQSEKK